ncbi:MAG: hypothetical protein WAO95_08510 [Burkholderiales bacterium]
MAIDYEHLMRLRREGERFRYGDRETMLYALGVGMGRDPLDEVELAYVFERPGAALKTVPSLATVLARVPLLKDCGYDYGKVVSFRCRVPERDNAVVINNGKCMLAF